MKHYFIRESASIDEGHHFFHGFAGMSEKGLESVTEMIQTRFAVGSHSEAVLGTTAITGKSDITFLAHGWQGGLFIATKSDLLRCSDEVNQRGVVNVSKFVIGFNEMVARI